MGDWRISVQETDEAGNVSARINEVLRGKPLRFEFMKRTAYLMDMEDDGRCCIQGIARLLSEEEATIEKELRAAHSMVYGEDTPLFEWDGAVRRR